MAQAIVVRELGGPEVLKMEGVTLAPPGPGEVQIRQAAIGLNFIDVYFRTGLYKSATGLPFIPGKEGAGRRDGGRRWRQPLFGGRTGGLCLRRRRLCQRAKCGRVPACESAGWDQSGDGRRDDAQRHEPHNIS